MFSPSVAAPVRFTVAAPLLAISSASGNGSPMLTVSGMMPCSVICRRGGATTTMLAASVSCAVLPSALV